MEPNRPSEITVDIDGRWNHNTAYFQPLLDAMPDPCRTALDIGCGDGLLARAMAQRSEHVTGIDPDHTTIEEARRLGDDDHIVEFVEGDFLTHAFDNRDFDFITAVASLHHMPTVEALSKTKDLLGPGGTLFVVGCAQSSTPTDFAYDVAGTIANRVVQTRRGFWQHSAPVTDPEITYAEMRRVADDQLPGSDFRRRLYYRYTLTWTRPR